LRFSANNIPGHPADPGLRGNAPDTARSLFGPPLPPGALLFLGAVAGAVAGADGQARAEPFLYLLAPAWFFQVFLQVWKPLRYPRTHSWPCVLGLSYEQRLGFSHALLKRKVMEFCPLALGAIAAFSIGQSIALRHAALNKCADCFSVFFIETACSSVALFSVIRWKLIAPIQSDRSGPIVSALKIGTPNLTSVYRLSGVFAHKVLPPGPAEIARRQLMYLLRMDLFSLIVFPPLALGITALLLFYVKGGFTLVGDAAAVISPFWLMADRTPVFDESIKKLGSCPYYSAAAADLFFSNVCFAVAACAPFAVLFMAARIFVYDLRPVSLIHLAAFLTGLLSVALIMTFRWLLPAWTSASSSMAATTLLCAVLGCAIPTYGILFPLFSILGIFVLLRNHGGKLSRPVKNYL
jgi:hypothetical protein